MQHRLSANGEMREQLWDPANLPTRR